MMTVKAIDTAYKGYLFRSRLEARWAVFFDALGLKWEYEVEGFDLDGVWYLPDFLVKTPQGADMWVEVKREGVSKDPKFERFKKAVTDSWDYSDTGKAGYPRAMLVSGTPKHHLLSHEMCPRCGMFFRMFEGEECYRPDRFYHYECDFETPCGGDNPPVSDGVLGTIYTPHKGNILCEVKDYSEFRYKLNRAATKAQQARFEHGACG